jgi:peptidoglycan glycosyltransferase
MSFEHSLKRLLVGLMLCFGAVLAAAVYWGVLGADQALASPFNYRQRDALQAIERGLILDHRDRTLVESVPTASGRGWQRQTADPALPGITGYASLTYGTGGAEAAYNAILTGSTEPQTLTRQFARDVLHLPQRGQDIRLTLDLDIQRAAAQALGTQTGAAVVMDAQTGALLAVVTAPSITPETLDIDWEALVQRPDTPFFNRALQGEYQPGSALHPVLLAGWLIGGHTADEALAIDLQQAVQIGETSLTCLTDPQSESATLLEAFLTGCPSGFAAALDMLGETATAEVMTLFGMYRRASLPGFTPVISSSADSTAAPTLTPTPVPTDWRADPLGQGQLRLSPLDMAVMMAALANDGNAPSPYLLEATRPTPDHAWEVVHTPAQTLPITTSQTAQAVRSAMQRFIRRWSPAGAALPDPVMGAHVGQARAGENTLTWFTGYVEIRPGHSIVAVILTEQALPVGQALQSGEAVLNAAFAAFAP